MLLNRVPLALGKFAPAIGIKWSMPNGLKPLECCMKHETEDCSARTSLSLVLYSEKNNVASLPVILDRLIREWEDEYHRFPPLTRGQVSAWLWLGLQHGQPGEFRWGRMTSRHDFIDVDFGDLALLFNLADFRGATS